MVKKVIEKVKVFEQPHNIKNPIAQIFGIVLRKKRLRLYNGDPDYIAKFIKVQPTYYRAVEAGTYNLHISHALKLSEVFDSFSYEALLKILSTITVIDAHIKEDDFEKNYFKSFNSIFLKLSEQDIKIKPLYDRVIDYLKPLELNKFYTTNEIVKLIHDFNLDNVLLDFIENYHVFGESPFKLQNSFGEKFFLDIPTNQIEIFETLKAFVKKQPTTYSSKTSFDWERKHQMLFKNCYILDTHPEIITGIKNLSNYQYDYLWLDSFHKVEIIFISNDSSQKYLKLFNENLRRVIENKVPSSSIDKEDIENKLKKFDTAFNKIEIKCIPKEYEKEIKDRVLHYSETNPYNATWVFSLENHLNVGVRAILEGDDARLTQGDYLNFEETLSTIQELQNLWKSF